MSLMKRAILLETTLPVGLSKMKALKMKKAFLVVGVLLMLLFSAAWAQPFVVHSTGLGPSFEVYPAVVIQGKSGFNITLKSSNTNVVYEYKFGKRIFFNQKSLVQNVSLRDDSYSYITIKAKVKAKNQCEPCNTSVATILLISPKIGVNVDKDISVWATPSAFDSSSQSTGTIFVLVNSYFGRKFLTVRVGKVTVMNASFSPFSDYPRMFKVPFNVKRLGVGGKQPIQAVLTLSNGAKISATSSVVACSTPTVQSFSISPKIVAPEKDVMLKVLANVSDCVGIKRVSVNGILTKYTQNEYGEWVYSATVPVNFSNVTTGATKVIFTIKVTDGLGRTYVKLENKEFGVKPRTPTDLHVISKGFNFITIGWNPSPGATKYEIYRSTNGKTFRLITKTNETKYVDGNLIPSTVYYYKVKATNASGSSGFSKVIKGPTLEIWWSLIGIFGSILILLLLTLYW